MANASDNAPRAYSRREEIWSASIHGAGIAFGVAAVAILATFSAIYQDAWAIVGTSIFGASIILLYTASTLYHAASREKLKKALKKFDHISIYYLIAGSYTPFLFVNIKGAMGWTIFGIIWGLAILGTTLKLCTAANGTKAWSIALYLLMGWLIIGVIWKLLLVMPLSGVVFLALGGLSYTLGVAFYVQKKKAFSHAIWHGFVLAGTVFHFFAVLFSCALVD
ncbi:MAG: hemolysin III family protein [Opitutales bacterium]|nr:hemolysin III family protein [Opitutales bacterium]